MNKHYCPFCSPKQQLILRENDGDFYCGHCGDKAIKVPLIRTSQLVALISVIAFLTPLFLMVFSLIKEEKKLVPQEETTFLMSKY